MKVVLIKSLVHEDLVRLRECIQREYPGGCIVDILEITSMLGISDTLNPIRKAVVGTVVNFVLDSGSSSMVIIDNASSTNCYYSDLKPHKTLEIIVKGETDETCHINRAKHTYITSNDYLERYKKREMLRLLRYIRSAKVTKESKKALCANEPYNLEDEKSFHELLADIRSFLNPSRC